MKVELEINYVGDDRVFLNFWDHVGGEDQVCQLIDGKLIDFYGVEITIQEYIDRVKKVADNWT